MVNIGDGQIIKMIGEREPVEKIAERWVELDWDKVYDVSCYEFFFFLFSSYDLQDSQKFRK